MHTPIKFDWLGVIIGYPYTHSIPHPPPIVNYFFKKIISQAKKKRVSRTRKGIHVQWMTGWGFPPDLLLVYHRRSPLSRIKTRKWNFSKIKKPEKGNKSPALGCPLRVKTPMNSITHSRGFVMFIASGRRNRSRS